FSYERHKIVWRILTIFLRPFICFRFNMKSEQLNIDGPIILVPNHVTSWDPLLVAACLPKKQIYFVASEHIFRLGFISKLINWLVAPIPRKKAAYGTDTIRDCIRRFKQGKSICLFAEGEQSWDGKNNPVFSATGKLVKTSGATLVTFRLEGAYLCLPRWRKKLRRGKVFAHPIGIYPPEKLRSMKPEEINQLINRDIYEDAWERQRIHPVHYKGKHIAEGMESVLYLCPECRRVGTIETKDDQVFCSCGFRLRYTDTGFFSPDSPFVTIADWEQWQRKQLCSGNFLYSGTELFSDEEIELSIIKNDHSEKVCTVGKLIQYNDSLDCGEYHFPLNEIGGLALVQAHLLLMSYQGDYYQFRTRKCANLRKYFEVWKNSRNNIEKNVR
ncbi:MAG: 1-acyl-sn-glycerol-3-phosphate acyltransferase, partial [Parasporobacterium sp.]|nr:1-acyl-sn-glycerol-3-phosphate acyltransferase [Parasporobacterium sp.]